MDARATRSGEPQFEARPGTPAGWCVRIEWPSGATDTVTGFPNQYDALNWIKRDATNWVVDRIFADT